MSVLEQLRRAMASEKPWAARFSDEPDFVIEATNTANETGKVADLDLKGFQPITGYLYFVKIRHWAQDGLSDAQKLFSESEWAILGSNVAGTDPVLASGGGVPAAGGRDGNIMRAFGFIGGAATAYGRVHVEHVMGTGDTATKTSPGCSIAASPDGLDDMTLPAHRISKVIGQNLYDPSYSAADGQLLAFAAAGGTDGISTADNDGTGAQGAPGAGAVISGTFELTPPASAFLAVDGSPDPGTIDVHIITSENDAFNHYIEVFVAKPIAIPVNGA